ncbi:DUF1109 domain-containing protein [Paraburkholderia sp.]|jgi:hypothetical protein|uniref:DUF1109 domain-containing protein n=1 Tax=Paraburkholderia sp. TaxID=1926495 RepID=UPI002F41CFB2
MKTDDLISLLATGVAPVAPKVAIRYLLSASAVAALGALLLALGVYGLRPDIDQMLTDPLYWSKLAFPLALSAGAFVVTTRLSRPATAIGSTRAALLALPVVVLWLAAIADYRFAAPDSRDALLMGHTWRTCPVNIALLSVPGFVAFMKALGSLAPTRLRSAGAAAGLLAGAVATLAYCLHCPEMGVPFWAVWYVLGIAIPTAAGALLGPRMLRW